MKLDLTYFYLKRMTEVDLNWKERGQRGLEAAIQRMIKSGFLSFWFNRVENVLAPFLCTDN